MTVHSKIKNMLSSIFKELNCWIYCPCDTIHKGIPDMLILSMNGKFIAVEIKVGRDRLGALQEKTLGDITCRKGISSVAIVVDNEFIFSFRYIGRDFGTPGIESVMIGCGELYRSPYPMGKLARDGMKNALIKIL